MNHSSCLFFLRSCSTRLDHSSSLRGLVHHRYRCRPRQARLWPLALLRRRRVRPVGLSDERWTCHLGLLRSQVLRAFRCPRVSRPLVIYCYLSLFVHITTTFTSETRITKKYSLLTHDGPPALSSGLAYGSINTLLSDSPSLCM